MSNLHFYLEQFTKLQEKIFIEYCIQGNIKEAKKYSINLPFKTYKRTFYTVLEKNDLHTAKWMATIQPTLLSEFDKRYFWSLSNYIYYENYYDNYAINSENSIIKWMLKHNPSLVELPMNNDERDSLMLSESNVIKLFLKVKPTIYITSSNVNYLYNEIIIYFYNTYGVKKVLYFLLQKYIQGYYFHFEKDKIKYKAYTKKQQIAKQL